MIRSIAIASLISCAFLGSALAQSTITGAPRGEIPDTGNGMMMMHHHHYYHHHHRGEQSAWNRNHSMHPGMTTGNNSMTGSPVPNPQPQ